MTPAARLSGAIEVLDAWLAGGLRAERLLRDWGRANRYAGSGDRRAIADMVYACIRRRRTLTWPFGREDGRALVLGLAREEGLDAAALFSGARYGPAPLSGAESAALEGAEAALAAAPEPVRCNHPDWLEGPLKAALGADYAAVMAALGGRAPVDLRVNRLKAAPEAASQRLAAEGVETAPAPLDPDALRAAPGARVAQTACFAAGWVELQDAASQAAARMAGAAPGMAVLDYCAGGGGKTLALAALMGGEGRLAAHDIAPERMAGLPERARRAGARVEISPDPAPAVFDCVFVDAPCSGSGAWRRDPEAKWRITPERLAELTAMQEDAFAGALTRLRPGGQITYATCSLLAEENEARAARLESLHPQLVREAERRFSPLDGGDGFYALRWRMSG